MLFDTQKPTHKTPRHERGVLCLRRHAAHVKGGRHVFLQTTEKKMDSLFFRSIADVAQKAARTLGSMHAPRQTIGVFYEPGANHFVIGLIALPEGSTKWVAAVEKNGIVSGADF